MRIAILASGLLVTCVACGLASAPSPPTENGRGKLAPSLDDGGIAVDVAIIADDSSPRLQVRATFPADELGQLLFTYPKRSHCADAKHAVLAIENADRLVDDRDGVVVALRPTYDGPVTITYEVQPALRDFTFPLRVIEECDPVVFSRDVLFAEGTGIFIRPRAMDKTGEPVRLGKTTVSFRKLPAGWSLASSLGESEAEPTFLLESFDQLLASQFMAGAYTKESTFVEGVRVSVLAPGRSPGHSRVVAMGIARALPYFIKRWGEAGGATHTIFLMSTSAGGQSFGGLVAEAKGHSQYIVHADTADLQSIVQSALHELVHMWVTMQAPSYEALDFVREGIPEYVSHRAMYALGLASADRLIERANTALRNRVLADVPQLDRYDEGFLMALALDSASLEAGGAIVGMDEVIRRLIADKGEPADEASYMALVRAAGLIPQDAPLQRSSIALACELEIGGTVWRLMAGKWPSREKAYALFEDSNVFWAVDPDGPAYRAGVRVGQTLVAIEGGANGSITAPLVLRIRDANGAERRLSYLPHGAPESMGYAQYVDAAAPLPDSADARLSMECRSRHR